MTVIIGQNKGLDKQPLLSEEERKVLFQQAEAVAKSGQPPEIPAMMPSGAMIRLAATLKTYEDLVRDLSDALGALSNSESEAQLVESAQDFAALIEAAQTALNAPMPVIQKPSPLAVGPGLGGGPLGGFRK